jgi:hypothetical protein
MGDGEKVIEFLLSDAPGTVEIEMTSEGGTIWTMRRDGQIIGGFASHSPAGQFVRAILLSIIAPDRGQARMIEVMANIAKDQKAQP